MAMIDIPFGEWLPDQPSFKNPGCEIADNVVPKPNGYGPLSGLIGQGDAAAAAVRGAAFMVNNSGASVLVGGTDDSLFIRTSSLVETTGLSSIGSGEAWDFARFNDFVIATAVNNNPQYLSDIDTDTSWSDLTGSPPVAKRCAKVGEFLMLGNIASYPGRVQWSAYNSPATSWADSRLTQAGFVDMPEEFGEVQRISGGRYALVFQKRGISRLTYVGPPLVWRSDIISSDRGTVAPFSVVTVGYLTYFLAQDGFYVTNGASIDGIGSRRINDWFFGEVDQSAVGEVHGAVDWQNECIVWAFSSGGMGFDRLIIYSWSEGRWSSGTLAVDWLVQTTLDGIDIESLDAIYTDLDQIPLSLDSAEFAPKDSRLAAFVDGEYSTFTGDPLEANWTTGELQPAPGQRVFVNEVMPVISASNWDAGIGLLLRDNFGVRTNTPMTACGNGGFAPVSGEGQKVAISMVKPSGVWAEAQGVQVRFRPCGQR
jgi:hypothetical protein